MRDGTSLGGLEAMIFQLFDRIARLCVAIAGIGLVGLIVIFGWLVFGRYVLNDTPTWVEQVALLLVVWITFLGGAAGVWTRSHLSVDFIRESLPPLIRTPLRWVCAIGVLVFGLFLAWQGGVLAASTWPRVVPMIGISEGYRAVPMAICGACTVLFSLFHLYELTKGGQN
ncbi:2,3-diketo-L-gulonate TRAP transporter small permease protein YiaM [Aquimixticola soesokkakensis]|uniref:TRAP transporter small permease protein n=2 Tax=Aquimixticola soesokkakensis TaxID=1519096 RepID=A0A1Y5RS59_9RHOB|nr:2,3-diketo-L-gulonate TRAP transporter small permease protein YiaM [Aquimixticola soesokkakensis]